MSQLYIAAGVAVAAPGPTLWGRPPGRGVFRPPPTGTTRPKVPYQDENSGRTRRLGMAVLHRVIRFMPALAKAAGTAGSGGEGTRLTP